MKTLVFSPHCDDAGFSLGGALLKKVFGDAVVFNVFTQTNYSLDGVKHVNPVTKMRQKEDQKVMNIIKARSFYMGFTDACLRTKYKKEEEAYLNPLHEPTNDGIWKSVYFAIRKIIRRERYTYLLFPLGLGYHIDHRILSEIGRLYLKRGFPILFYEDITYDMTSDDTMVQLYVNHFESQLKNKIIRIGKLQVKIDLVKLYKTQVNADIIASIQSTARDRGGERIWSISNLLRNF